MSAYVGFSLQKHQNKTDLTAHVRDAEQLEMRKMTENMNERASVSIYLMIQIDEKRTVKQFFYYN